MSKALDIQAFLEAAADAIVAAGAIALIDP
jgi:hypothetical protein